MFQYRINRNKSKILSIAVLGFILSSFFINCAKSGGGGGSSSSSAASTANDIGSKFSGQLVSEVQSISSLGEVWGYAYDPQNKSSTVKVIFYANGPVGSGEYAGETQASVQSIGPSAGHFFSFKLPAKFADGKSRYLVAYAVEARQEYVLYPGAMNYTSFTPKAEAVFNQQIAGFVQTNCTRCHTWNYQQLYSGPLLRPKPGAGGNAINNTLISKMSGVTGHNGGSFCNGVNDGICLELQRWWQAEFQ